MNIKQRKISWPKAILLSFLIVFVLLVVAVYIMDYTYDQVFDSIGFFHKWIFGYHLIII